MQTTRTLCDDVLIMVFDRVTLAGDFSARLNLLLSVPFLRDYSRSNRHMLLVFRRWHQQGCFTFKQKIQRPLPDTLTQAWLDTKLVHLRKFRKNMHSIVPNQYYYSHQTRCDVCGFITLCNLL